MACFDGLITGFLHNKKKIIIESVLDFVKNIFKIFLFSKRLKRKGVQLKLWRKKLALCVPRENKSGTINKKIKTKIKREKEILKKWIIRAATKLHHHQALLWKESLTETIPTTPI